MEAKDTVIDIGEDKYDGLGADTLVEIQAEISFKAGEDKGYRNGDTDGYNRATRKAVESMLEHAGEHYKAGIREVVGWLKKYYEHYQDNPFWKAEWQDKLKEWGIK